MRLFFGLKPDDVTCMAIDRWRERMLPPLERPVPPWNLHLTLAFLGEVPERELERLGSEADSIDAPAFTMTLDQLGYFPKPQVLWIGPSETPEGAVELAGELRKICRRLGLRTERRKFQAHLTIARRCSTPPPASALPPSFSVHFDSFELFESCEARLDQLVDVNVRGSRLYPSHV